MEQMILHHSSNITFRHHIRAYISNLVHTSAFNNVHFYISASKKHLPNYTSLPPSLPLKKNLSSPSPFLDKIVPSRIQFPREHARSNLQWLVCACTRGRGTAEQENISSSSKRTDTQFPRRKSAWNNAELDKKDAAGSSPLLDDCK